MCTHVYQQGNVTATGYARLGTCRTWLCLLSGSTTAMLVGNADTATCAPPQVATPSLRAQFEEKEAYTIHNIHVQGANAYPHLGPCTSGGMSMTIAPPEGPTWKKCLGPQVSSGRLGLGLVRVINELLVGSQYWVVLE
jgi:hypothetical protein